MKELADGSHFLGAFERLGIVNYEEQVFVLTPQQASQHIEGDFLHYNGLIPNASPEEFAMVGAMRAVAKNSYESVNGASVTYAYGQYHRPEIVIDILGDLHFDGLEKSLDFLGNFADGNHTASLHISTCVHNAYRQSKLFLFDYYHYRNFANRSV
jgi:hypothetical protein